MNYRQIKGFTILEVAIVLAIVGLLLAGGVNLLSTSSDTAKYKQAQYDLQEVKEAMLSFYNINKYVPCPDTDGDGIENPPTRTGVCTNIRGFLPHVTLGIGGAGGVRPVSGAPGGPRNAVLDPCGVRRADRGLPEVSAEAPLRNP